MNKFLPLALALGLSTNIFIANPPVFGQYEYNMEADYAKYYDKGIEYYNQSEYSKAIEQFTQALKMGPTNSAVRNNLAVSHISRGTYFHNTLKNYDSAAENYRDAIYYLKYDAPEGTPDSPNAAGNYDIALKNLKNAQLGLGITDSPTYHFKKGQELRAKGMFRGAIVEYFLALQNSPPGADAFEAIGDMYRVLQNNDRAVSAYDKALNLKRNDPELFIKAGLAYEKADKLNSAIKAFNEASAIDPNNADALNALEQIWKDQIKLNPRNAAAHANLGTVLQKKGDFEGALEQYNAAELIEPNNILVRLNLGTLYQAKGDLNTATKAYDTILAVDPKNVLAHYYKATALKQMKNYDAARQELNTILQIEPNNAMAKKELAALAKEQAGGSDQLADVLKDIADKNPDDANAQYEAGFEAHSKGDINSAIRYYRKAISLNPNMADAYSNIGAALMANKQYDEALSMLNKASELKPGDENIKKLISEIKTIETSSKYDKALELHQQGNISEAIKLYQEALQTEPDNAEIYTNLGAAYQTNQNFDQALAMYKKAVELDATSTVALYYTGTAYHAKGDINQAISYYKKVLEIDPIHKEAKESLKSAEEGIVDMILSDALNAYNKKAYDQAGAAIDKALKMDPNNALAYYYMGLVAEAKNNASGAISNYKRATQLDPALDTAFYALAIALDKANDKAGAKVAFQKFVQLSGSKNDAFVQYARERLKQLP